MKRTIIHRGFSWSMAKFPHLYSIIGDKLYLKLAYWARMGKKLNLKNPQTFNEKLQWLKLNDRKPIYTTMVDKYEAKKYVADIIGGEYIIPTLGVWDKFEDINFDKLPDQFVLKCTHDSGGLVICKDKSNLDLQSARKKINKSLKNNYYLYCREWPYKNVKPRIIAEKYMVDESGVELKDYKFFCFNGKVRCFKIDFDRYVNHRANYFDRNKSALLFGESAYLPDYNKSLSIPNNIDEMIFLAEKFSVEISFLRVDFYDINGKIYFGEFTFYPASGFGAFSPESADLMLGDWLNLKTI